MQDGKRGNGPGLLFAMPRGARATLHCAHSHAHVCTTRTCTSPRLQCPGRDACSETETKGKGLDAVLASGWCELAPLAFALSEGRTKRKMGGQDGKNGCVRLRARGGGGWLHAAMVRGHLAGWMDRRNISLSRCRHVAPKRTGPSGSLDCCISHAIYSWVPAGMAEVFGVSVCRPDLAQCPPSHQHHGASVRATVSRVGKLERSKFMHTPLLPAGRVLDLSPRPGIPPGIILLVPFRGEAARTRTGAAHSCDLEKRGTSADKPHRLRRWRGACELARRVPSFRLAHAWPQPRTLTTSLLLAIHSHKLDSSFHQPHSSLALLHPSDFPRAENSLPGPGPLHLTSEWHWQPPLWLGPSRETKRGLGGGPTWPLAPEHHVGRLDVPGLA